MMSYPTAPVTPDNAQTAARDCLPKHYGEALIAAFHRAWRGAVLYSRDNVIFTHLIESSVQSIARVTALYGAIDLKIVRDACFLNNARVHVTADTFTHFKAFIQEMRARCLGEVEFRPNLTPAELTEFIYLLHALDDHNEGNYLYLKKRFAECGIRTIDVGKLETYKDTLNYTDSAALKRQSKEVYFTSIDLVKELMEDANSQKVLNVRKAKRLMLNAVDVIMRDESTLLGLANIKSYDDYTFNHSVNVAIYAVALGQRIGIPKKHLNYLGMAGLFHDIGKTGIDRAILNKPEQLTPAEWRAVQQHPVRGAEIVMGIRGWGELASRMMVAAFEHHVKYDLSGYPQRTHAKKPSLFSRIITLVDCYDAIGRPRVYRREPFLPDQIIAYLVQQSGKDFDPTLVKVFINMIGIYPMGSLVELDTGEIGVVMQIHEEAEFLERPKVCLLRRDGDRYVRGDVVDLTDMDAAHRAFTRTIARTLNPADYQVIVEEFFI